MNSFVRRIAIRSDRAENSIMQTVGIAVSALMATATIGFLGTATNLLGIGTGTTNYLVELDSADAYLTREIGNTHDVIEATPTRISVNLNDGGCVSYSLELDANQQTELVRTSGGCAGSKFLPEIVVVASNLTADSTFSFTNIAGLPLIDGQPTGECDRAFIPVECTSTVPAVVKLDAKAITPFGAKSIEVSVPTGAVRLTMLVSGDDDVVSVEAVRAAEFAD